MAGRRAAGEGSVHRLPDGRYRARRRFGPRGRYREVYAYGRTKKEALDNLAVEVRARNVERLGARSTVAGLMGWWADVELAEQVADGRLMESTRDQYATIARLHVTPGDGPSLAGERIGTLTASDVRAWMAAMRQAGKSARTRAHAHTVLRTALQAAVRYEVLDRNVARLVEPPRQRTRRRDPVTVESARALLTAAADWRPDPEAGNRRQHPWWLEALLWVGLSVPLRPGELLGAEWSRLDLDAQTLDVARNLVRLRGQWRLHDLKGHSARPVPLPDAAAAALRRWRARQSEARLAAGARWRAAQVVEVVAGRGRVRAVDLVFTMPGGGPVHLPQLNVELGRLCVVAGVPRLAPHSLRRAAVTMLRAGGVDTPVIMQLAGHTTEGMTDLYTGRLDAAMRQAVTELGGRLDLGAR